MHFNAAGASALFFLIPFFIGAFICGVAGICVGVYIIGMMADWIIDRIVVRYYVYSDFLKLVRTSAIKRRERAQANS
jgi:hypothetical protein